MCNTVDHILQGYCDWENQARSWILERKRSVIMRHCQRALLNIKKSKFCFFFKTIEACQHGILSGKCVFSFPMLCHLRLRLLSCVQTNAEFRDFHRRHFAASVSKQSVGEAVWHTWFYFTDCFHGGIIDTNQEVTLVWRQGIRIQHEAFQPASSARGMPWRAWPKVTVFLLSLTDLNIKLQISCSSWYWPWLNMLFIQSVKDIIGIFF